MASKRDPSTGRFIKPTPAERITAHMDRINALHPEHDSDCAVNSEPAYPAGPCDCEGQQPYDDTTQRTYDQGAGQKDVKSVKRYPEEPAVYAMSAKTHAELSDRFPQAAISKPKPAPSINKQAAAGIIWFIILTGLALIGLIVYLVLAH